MREQKRKGFDLNYLLGWVVVWIGMFLGIPELAKYISIEWSVGIIGGILCSFLYFLFKAKEDEIKEEKRKWQRTIEKK